MNNVAVLFLVFLVSEYCTNNFQRNMRRAIMVFLGGEIREVRKSEL